MGEEQTLRMCGVCKRFPGVVALDKVDFDLKKGEVHALVGENGAGKSTLIRILAGVYEKDAGEIYFNGKRIEIHNSADAQNLGFSFIHQELDLIPYFNAYENVVLGLKYPHNFLGLINWRKLRQRVQDIADSLNIDFNLRKPVWELSSSQRRMVMVARALVRKAKIIVMDESTAALGRHEIEILFNLINQLKKQEVSVIYISHRLEEIFSIADRVTVMRDGRNVATAAIEEVELLQLITLMLDKSLSEEYPKEHVGVQEVMFSVRGLTKQPDIEGISFDLQRGEVLGVTGLLGSGKTELAQALFGIDGKDSGALFLEGNEIRVKNPQSAIKHGIVLVPEERREEGLILNMSLKENITLAHLKDYLLTKVLRFLSKRKELSTAAEYIDSFSIHTSGPNQQVGFLSGGNQQKVVLAKWLAGKAKVVIFDEPTRGIDVGSKTEIYKLIGRIAKEGAAVILISSEIEEIMGICDRVLILVDGRIHREIEISETTSEEVVSACYGRNV
jgi:ribose transport system ATP-binding protein